MKPPFSLRLRELLLLGRTGLAALAVLLLSLVLPADSLLFRNAEQQALQEAQHEWEEMRGRYHEAEEEKRILETFLPRYRQIAEKGVLSTGDRLALLERIGQDRETHRLYPVQVEVGPEFPVFAPDPRGAGEAPLLRASQVKLSLSLLHEEDLLRLYEGMQRAGGFFIPEVWVIERREPARAADQPELRENLNASCRFFWLTTVNTVNGEKE